MRFYTFIAVIILILKTVTVSCPSPKTQARESLDEAHEISSKYKNAWLLKVV